MEKEVQGVEEFKMKKLFLIMLIGMFLILPIVSAWDWDNVKSFDKTGQYGTVTITNALGLGSDLAKYTLLENTDQCLINCYAKGITELYSDGVLFSDLRFKQTSGSFKDLDYSKIFVRIIETNNVEIEEYDCSKNITGCVVNGTHKEERVNSYWKEYNNEELKAGTYAWRIEGKKNPGERIDWVATSLGVNLDSWEWWDTNWEQKKELNITENTGVTLYNYTLLINVTYDANMQTDFSDLRFLNGSETGELSYWFDEDENGQRLYTSDSVMVWVKFPELTASVNNTYYMYYGNAVATNQSNIANTWLFADHFDNQTGTYAYEDNWVYEAGNCHVLGNTSDLQQEAGSSCSLNLSVVNNELINQSQNKRYISKTADYDGSNIFRMRLGSNYRDSIDFYAPANGFFDDVGTNTTMLNNTMADNQQYWGDWANPDPKPINDYNIYELLRYNNTAELWNNWTLYINNTFTNTTNQGASPENLLMNIRIEDNPSMNLTFIAIGEYAFPEPSYTFGGEETLSFVTLISPDDAYSTQINSIVFNCSGEDIAGIDNLSVIIDNNEEANYTEQGLGAIGLGLETTIVGFSEGSHTWNCNMTNSLNTIVTATERTFSIDTTAPNINITYPENTTYSNVTTLDYITNANGACWYSLDKGTSNTTITCGDNVTGLASNLTNTWTVYINDSAGNENKTSVDFTLFLFEEATNFNATTYETSTEIFEVNITYNPDYAITADLIYNGTLYSSSKSQSGDNVLFSADLDIPAIALEENNSLYWQVQMTANSITQYTNTTLYNQTVQPIVLEICEEVTETPYINFTSKDEKTLALVNMSIDVTFSYWKGTGTTQKNYSYSNSTETESSFAFCVTPVDITLLTDLSMEYSSAGYSDRTYYLNNAPLTNISSDIILYFLNDSDSVKFFFTLKEDLSPVTDAIVTISKYNTGTGTYDTIGIRQTDDLGKFIEYLELDKEYQYSVAKDGTFLGVIYKTSMCSVAPCEVDLELEKGVTDILAGYHATYATDVAYNLTYDDNTKMVNFIFVDLTGLANYFRLEVNQGAYNQTGINICNVSSYTTAGTITCNLTDYEGNFFATGYVSRSPELLIDILSSIRSAIADVLGNDGLLFTLVAVVVMAFVGIWNPVVGIILVITTLFFATVMGFLSISITAIVLIAILGFFVIVKMGKGGGV